MPRSDPTENFRAQSEIGLPEASPARTWSFQFLDIGRVLEDIFQPIFEQMSRVVFLFQILDFLKIVLSPTREHHFGRSGADSEPPRISPNPQNEVLEGAQT